MDLTELIGALWDLRERHGNVPVWLLDAGNGRLDVESVDYNRSQRGVYVAAAQVPDEPQPAAEPHPARVMWGRMRYDAGTEG